MVVRIAGGRVSAGVLKDLANIGYLASALVAGGPQFEAAVVHHEAAPPGSSPAEAPRRLA